MNVLTDFFSAAVYCFNETGDLSPQETENVNLMPRKLMTNLKDKLKSFRTAQSFYFTQEKKVFCMSRSWQTAVPQNVAPEH